MLDFSEIFTFLIIVKSKKLKIKILKVIQIKSILKFIYFFL